MNEPRGTTFDSSFSGHPADPRRAAFGDGL